MTKNCEDAIKLTSQCVCGDTTTCGKLGDQYCIEKKCYTACTESATLPVRTDCYYVEAGVVAPLGSIVSGGSVLEPCAADIVLPGQCACVNYGNLGQAYVPCDIRKICSSMNGSPECYDECKSDTQMFKFVPGETCQCGNALCDLTSSQCYHFPDTKEFDGETYSIDPDTYTGSSLGSFCLKRCIKDAVSDSNCICEQKDTSNNTITTAIAGGAMCGSDNNIWCSDGGMGTCQKANGDKCAIGQHYRASDDTCQDSEDPCKYVDIFPTETVACKCEAKNEICLPSQTCATVGTKTIILPICSYNRAIGDLTYVNDSNSSLTKVVGGQCLCKAMSSSAVKLAIKNQICNVDGTITCVDGMHLNKDGVCVTSCTSSAGRNYVPGKVTGNCYCGFSDEECTPGQFCLGAALTSDSQAKCFSPCSDVGFISETCVCELQTGDSAYSTDDSLCMLKKCVLPVGSVGAVPHADAKCVGICENEVSKVYISGEGGCACAQFNQYSTHTAVFLPEGGVCKAGIIDPGQSVYLLPCSASIAASAKCICGNDDIAVERQYCIPDESGSYISKNTKINCSTDESVCGDYYLCTSGYCVRCAEGQIVMATDDAGTLTCVPICEQYQILYNSCGCIGPTNAYYSLSLVDKYECIDGVLPKLEACVESGAQLAKPCLCGQNVCQEGSVCENYKCTCKVEGKILRPSENGCYCANAQCGKIGAYQACMSVDGVDTCVPRCVNSDAESLNAECACGSAYSSQLVGQTVTLIQKQEYCLMDGTTTEVCVNGVQWTNTTEKCSCGDYGAMCSNGQYCNYDTFQCTTAIPNCQADTVVTGAGCMFNTTTHCPPGNKYNGTDCLCANRVALNGGADTCKCGTGTCGGGSVCDGTNCIKICAQGTDPSAECACFSGDTYKISATGEMCTDGEVIPECHNRQVNFEKCYCELASDTTKIMTCQQYSYCDTGVSDETKLCTNVCPYPLMNKSANVKCVCGTELCDLTKSPASGTPRKQCYNKELNTDGSSNGSICIEYDPGNEYSTTASYTPLTKTVLCGTYGVCGMNNICTRSYELNKMLTCTETTGEGPCTEGIFVCTDEERYSRSSRKCEKATEECADAERGPCTCKQTICNRNQVCHLNDGVCATIRNACYCGHDGMGDCVLPDGNSCAVGERCNVSSEGVYSCVPDEKTCEEEGLLNRKLLENMLECRCGSTICRINAYQACVGEGLDIQCAYVCQVGITQSYCACIGDPITGATLPAAEARLTGKSQTCQKNGVILCSTTITNLAECKCGNSTCASGADCTISASGLGSCSMKYCTSNVDMEYAPGIIENNCVCGENICKGASGCINSITTKTGQCLPICSVGTAGTGCICNTDDESTLASVCYGDMYCSNMGGTMYAETPKKGASCLPKCGFGLCTVECRCSLNPVLNSCKPGQYCAHKFTVPTDIIYSEDLNDYPNDQMYAYNVCTAKTSAKSFCACGPGKWSYGAYLHVLIEECKRCNVDETSWQDCECQSGEGSVKVECKKDMGCVHTGDPTKTRELCLKFCEASNTAELTEDCACKAPNGKLTYALPGDTCTDQGVVIKACASGAVEKQCYCGGTLCARGNNCVDNACTPPTAECQDGVSANAEACVCGTIESCYQSPDDACFSVDGQYHCLEVCNEINFTENCSCKKSDGTFDMSPNECLCKNNVVVYPCENNVIAATTCYCDRLEAEVDVTGYDEAINPLTQGIACVDNAPLPQCENHNTKPEASDCACAPEYVKDAEITKVSKGKLCSYLGIPTCKTNADCQNNSFCNLNNVCTRCSKLFSGCQQCTDEKTCTSFTSCSDKDFLLSGKQCVYCTGKIKNGKCVSTSLSTGAIAGIACSCAVVVIAASLLAVWYCRRHRKD